MSCIHLSYIYDNFLFKILFITHQKKDLNRILKIQIPCYLFFVGWNAGSDSKTVVVCM